MSRGLSSANAAAASAAHVRPIVFVEVQFDSGTVRMHNGAGTYLWGGNSWLGAGALGEISPIEEADDLSPYRVSYRLSGIDSVILAEALTQEVYERLVIVYHGFLDDDGALVDDPFEFRRDYMDTIEVALGGDLDSVTIHCESEHIRDARAPGGMFTDEDQQAIYAGDAGFEYLPQMIDAQFGWGPGHDPVYFGEPPEPPWWL